MYKLVVGVIAATLTIAACGGSDKKDTTPAAGDSTTTTTADGSGSSTSAPGGGSDEFSQLVAKAKAANFKVTYTTQDGSSETIAQDGNGKVAIISDGSLLISDGTKTISCDGTTSSATCTDTGAAGAGSLTALTGFFTATYAGLTQLNSTAFGGHTSSERIADRDATCVSYKSSDIAGGALTGKIPGDPGVTACVDAETGILLKYSTTLDDKTTDEYVATAAGESSPSDFEPPSTPVTVPGLPGS
jgi:hypothetical protein